MCTVFIAVIMSLGEYDLTILFYEAKTKNHNNRNNQIAIYVETQIELGPK